MAGNDWLAIAVTFIVCILWLRLIDLLAHRGWLESRLSRKIIHIGTGPLFVLCWLLFTPSYTARFLAASVPLLITLQFAMVGLGILKDKAAVQAMSRTGDRREILRGPLFYGIIFVMITVFYWLDSPIGIIALMIVCGGDGMADIIGRRWGRVKLPWNSKKSWAGSLAFLLGGWLLSGAILIIFAQLGILSYSVSQMLIPLTWIALSTALVESLSPPDIDNISIAVTALLLGHFLF